MSDHLTIKPDLSEARRLLGEGIKLCQLQHMQKRPKGNGWQLQPITTIDDDATGYGAMLALNGLCSIDPDNEQPAREGLARCGFDMDALMAAGVRTTSTRPGSGGRSAFRAPTGLKRLVFASKTHGTILELRAGQSNLQDCVAGVIYNTTDNDTGEIHGPYVQRYANCKRLDDAPDLPPRLREWWLKCSEDVTFFRERQRLFCGEDAVLAVSSCDGGELAFKSDCRTAYNMGVRVPTLLERHGYRKHGNRWAPASATGAPCVRPIPGKDGLWQSDHASDPLHGKFDAWTAYVVLDHGGELIAAEREYTDHIDKHPLILNILKRNQQAIKNATSAAPAAPLGAGLGEPGSHPLSLKNAVVLSEIPSHASHVPNIMPIQTALAEPLNLEYVVQHVLIKGWLYAMTANPGSGKTAVSLYMAVMLALGRPFMGRKTLPCKVLFLCGENPQDVRIRTEVMLLDMGVPLEVVADRIYFTRRPFAIDKESTLARFVNDVQRYGPFDLMFIDTGPAHSEADDENGNREMHALAIAMRDLMRPLGMPCTIALMHPVKGAGRDNLLPRGGGSFTGSIDGALCLWREGRGSPSELFPHPGKFRGRPFDPLWFELAQVTHPTARDNFGDVVQTVIAKPGQRELPAVEIAHTAKQHKATEAEQAVIRYLHELAADAGSAWAQWYSGGKTAIVNALADGGIAHRAAQKAIDALLKDGYVQVMQDRESCPPHPEAQQMGKHWAGRYVLTDLAYAADGRYSVGPRPGLVAPRRPLPV